MKKNFVYLASASPRRRDLLAQIGVAFEARPAAIDERRRPAETPRDYVMRVAAAKAEAAAARICAESGHPVLAADTAVVLDDEILGKPHDEAAALEMLEALSGREHVVLTAVSMRWRGEQETLLSTSKVRFRATTAAEREAYCRTREPLDKAGAYGIQGYAAVFVERLCGSYSAVVGLPLNETTLLLKRCGIPDWLEPAREAG
jgi:nucleoside triphosphate pyrophosphatase